MGNIIIETVKLSENIRPKLVNIREQIKNVSSEIKSLKLPDDFSPNYYNKIKTESLKDSENVVETVMYLIYKIDKIVRDVDNIERKSLFGLSNLLDMEAQLAELFSDEFEITNDTRIDFESIYINYVSKLENAFIGNEEIYKKYCDYIIGKKIGDIVDDDGRLILLKDNILTKEDQEKINKILAKYNEKNKLFPGTNEGAEYTINASELAFTKIKEYKICEIVNTSSEFDAVVLQSPYDGSYEIISSSTNKNDMKDIVAISYPLLMNLYGNEYVVNMLSSLLSGIISNENPKSCYNQQLKDCENLIKKYTDIGKVNLNAYSLGGGITITAYANLKKTNYKNLDNINTVTLYNPYLLYMHTSVSGEMIGELSKDKKLTIYSAEGDIVSTLNPYLDELEDRIVYVKSKPMDFSKEDQIEFTNLYNYIIGQDGNHGIMAINCTEVKEGSYQNINELVEQITGIDYIYDRYKFEPDDKYMKKVLLDSVLKTEEAKQICEKYNLNLDRLYNYLIETRTIETDELTEIIIDTMFDSIVVEYIETSDKIPDILTAPAYYLKEKFKNIITSTPENNEVLLQSLIYLLKGYHFEAIKNLGNLKIKISLF